MHDCSSTTTETVFAFLSHLCLITSTLHDTAEADIHTFAHSFHRTNCCLVTPAPAAMRFSSPLLILILAALLGPQAIQGVPVPSCDSKSLVSTPPPSSAVPKLTYLSDWPM